MLRSWLSSTRSRNWLVDGVTVLAGSAADVSRKRVPSRELPVRPGTADRRHRHLRQAGAGKGLAGDKPKPLYLRAPDAKPQAHLALPRRGA